MTALELWLVRHGESTWNREGRVQGHSNPELSEWGQQQARRLGSRLARTVFDTIFSSDVVRALETARLALPAQPIEVDARLRELYFGAWEGQRWDAVAQDEGEALSAWLLEPYTCSPTGGEAYEALRQRVLAWRCSLPERGRVIAFTHGGPIHSLLYGLTGTPLAQRWRFEVPPASLTKLVLGDRGAILKTVGDVAHLEGAQLEPPEAR